jgi:hypothetical protein
LFVALGVQLWNPRSSNNYSSTKQVVDKASIETLSTEKARQTIVAAFGEGSDEQAILAWRTRGKGTVLVNGGGDALPLPHAVRVRSHQAAYEKESISAEVDLTGLIATCKQCGANLVPHVTQHRLGGTIKENHPRSIEDCQKLTNQRVVRVSSFDSRYPSKWGFVERFATWDGEALHDPLFCNTRCAVNYGRRAAIELSPLPADGSIVPIKRPVHESVDHYDYEDKTIVIDGKTFKI